jgi:hypothetical protein
VSRGAPPWRAPSLWHDVDPRESPGRPLGDTDGDRRVQALVEAAFVALEDAEVDGAILRATGPPDALELAWFPLDDVHPLHYLLRLVAPAHWQALGVSCSGSVHRLDDSGRARSHPDDPSVRVSMLVHRSGATAGILADGRRMVPLPDRPEGVVADACRRALSLPTAPPAATTAELWTLYWLDRVVEAAVDAGARSRRLRWPQVAALHPAAAVAAASRADPPAVPDPPMLAAATAALARQWTWSRLRADPAALDLPWLDLSPGLAAWMDDGMWARWLHSGVPALPDLMATVTELLGTQVAEAVARVVEATCTA